MMMIYVGISLAVSTVGLHFTISLPISFGRLKMHDRKMVHNNEQRIEKKTKNQNEQWSEKQFQKMNDKVTPARPGNARPISASLCRV